MCKKGWGKGPNQSKLLGLGPELLKSDGAFYRGRLQGDGFGAQKSRVVFSEFPSLGPIDLWGQLILGCGGCSARSRLSGSLLGLCPLAACNTSPPPSCDSKNILWQNVPGGQDSPGWEPGTTHEVTVAGRGVRYAGRGPREASMVADEIYSRYGEEFSVRW